MKEESMTKAQLITEVKGLRRRLAEMEEIKADPEKLKDITDYFKYMYERAPLGYQSLDEHGNLIVDGHLELLRQLLSVFSNEEHDYSSFQQHIEDICADDRLDLKGDANQLKKVTPPVNEFDEGEIHE